MRQVLLSRRRFPLMVVSLLFIGIASSGCGNSDRGARPSGKVTVTITYGGEPVIKGRVDLSMPNSGDGGGGELTSSGETTISQVAVGTYTVTVSPPPSNLIPVGPGQTQEKPKEYLNIPAKFRLGTTSTLKAEVKIGANKCKFDLKE